MLFRIFIICIFTVTFCQTESEFYEFAANEIENEKVISSMSEYKGKVLLIVNVASECGFTDHHYEELVELQQKYDQEDFAILAFPCNQFGEQEPQDNHQIYRFALKEYKVNFKMFSKIETIGKHAHALYKWLKLQTNGHEPNWNFCKYLLNQNGEVVRFASPVVGPKDMESDIEKLLSHEKLTGSITACGNIATCRYRERLLVTI